MLFYQITLLAIIQGLTEFLPVSSSGHILLFFHSMHHIDDNNILAVAVHLGTLGAVIIYFWRDVFSLIINLPHLFRRKKYRQTLHFFLIIATLPAVIFGTLISLLHLSAMLNSVIIVGWTMIIYGLILGFADKVCRPIKDMTQFTAKDALYVGLGQALALIPGTSRSGACITVMRLLNFDRPTAAKFSFLLSIPSIIAAATLTIYKSYDTLLIHHTMQQFLFAIGLSFLSGLIAISFMMRWLKTATLKPFVYYRVIFGSFLLYWAYFINY